MTEIGFFFPPSLLSPHTHTHTHKAADTSQQKYIINMPSFCLSFARPRPFSSALICQDKPLGPGKNSSPAQRVGSCVLGVMLSVCVRACPLENTTCSEDVCFGPLSSRCRGVLRRSTFLLKLRVSVCLYAETHIPRTSSPSPSLN